MVRGLCRAVVMTVAAFSIAAPQFARGDDREAAAVLRKVGVLVKTDSDGWIRELSFAGSKKGLGEVAAIAPLTKVEVLDFTGQAVTDEHLLHLKSLASLQILVLAKTKVTDNGMAQLSGLEKLEGLDLSETAVTGASLAQFKRLTQLAELQLAGTGFADVDVPQVKHLPSLKSLNLAGSKLSSGGLRKLKASHPKLIVAY